MYLKEVKIKNFRGYGENNSRDDHCYIYSSLDSQLVVFHGFNGFGKTSFYEAVEWCLTDNVYRLNKFYDDETYYANELKKSHYLKFYHPLDGVKRNREIYVELNFTNGLSIVRTSYSPILKTSVNDKSYSSTVFMGYNGQLESVSNEKVLSQFIKETNNKDTFFNTHMLGQESIGDFLRNNSPFERREIFMQLLQEEKLASSIEALRKLKAPNNKISIKLKQLNTELTNFKNTKSGISQSFTKLGFENELQYLDLIKRKLEPILELLKTDVPGTGLNLSLITDREVNLNSVGDLLENVSILHQDISNQQRLVNSEMHALHREYERVKKLGLLRKAENMLKLAHHAQMLQEHNIVEIRKEISTLIASINNIRNKNIVISQRKNEIEKYDDLFLNITKKIDFVDKKIDSSFWSNYSYQKNELRKFDEDFSDILSLLGEQYALVKTSTDTELAELKSKEQLFQNERMILLNDLANCRQTKTSLSKLNAEYQASLKVVKEYIATNTEEVTECPVCLNSDFSNERYKDLLAQWGVDASVASKLISIIDSTFAKGNKQIESISYKETDILAKVRELEENFESNILNKLKLELEAVSLTLVNQRTFILNEFNSRSLSLVRQEKELNTRKNELDRNVSNLTDSLKILFGDLGNLEQIKKDDLEKYIIDCEDWMGKNYNGMGFLQIPNLSEIISEINSLHPQDIGKEQNEASLLSSIQNSQKVKEFADSLYGLLSEVLKYRIPIEFSRSLGEFSQLDKKIEEVDKYIEVLSNSKGIVDNQYNTLFSKQKRIIKQRLENHPIIGWVYEAINPHPFHKKLHITNTDRGTNFTGRTQLEDKIDLYLDQIFSAAQLNILALSIFLGLGLTQSYSELEQLFLDDPIQSMDDVNILAFIDVLRAIMDSSKYKDKRLIISTHDDNFAQLLSIKMRNKKTVQYHIIGYTEEGPIIKQI